jgi:hypothetical protein
MINKYSNILYIYMTRSRSKSKSNRLKKNKTKRYRQTKNKRRRQHGGEVKKYYYTPDSATILKTGSVTNLVLIPGYSEIVDMMKEYETDESNKLKDGIKERDVKLLSDCSLPEHLIPEKIIVLRKEDKKKFIVFKDHNSSIKCDPNQYYTLASYNFKIFIEDILDWNPFLNLPEKQTKNDTTYQVNNNPHVYSSERKFKMGDWWNEQTWWTTYKGTLALAAPQPPSPPAAHPSSSSQPVDLSQQPPPQLRQQPNVELEQKRAQLHLLTNELKETLNELQREGKITEEVKTTLTNKIIELLTRQR